MLWGSHTNFPGMFPKHISAYALIISLIIAIKCDKPPLPLPKSVPLGIVSQASTIEPQLSKEFMLTYPHPHPLVDYEDSEAAYGHAQSHSAQGHNNDIGN